MFNVKLTGRRLAGPAERPRRRRLLPDGHVMGGAGGHPVPVETILDAQQGRREEQRKQQQQQRQQWTPRSRSARRHVIEAKSLRRRLRL